MFQISNLVVDSHQHFWKYDPVKHSWIGEEMAIIRKDFLPADLEPVLERNGVSGTVLIQADQSEAETDFLLKLGEESSFVKGVVGWVDLQAENAGERLLHYRQHPLFKGVRHTVWDEEGEFMLEPKFHKGISQLGKLDLTYDLLVFDYQLRSAVELVRQFPEQKFVLDHLGKPTITFDEPSLEWEKHVRELANFDNVSCKLSGMFTQTPNFNWKDSVFKPYLNVVTEAFGPEKLMFGSDWPVSHSVATYKEVLTTIRNFYSSFPETDVKRILGENAVKFYNLDL